MSDSGPPSQQMETVVWEKLESVIRNFEDALASGHGPRIDDYLDAAGVHRPLVLPELVHAELEYRLKQHEPVGLESYLDLYPELRRNQEAVLELMATKYRIRRRREPALRWLDYARRFPEFEALAQSFHT